MTDRITIAALTQWVGSVVRVSVLTADGSAPREAGATLVVSEVEVVGTIGGGALEFEAIAEARRFARVEPGTGWHRCVITYPLGPALGQCCGGMVSLMYERFSSDELSTLKTRLMDVTDAGVLVRSTMPGSAPVIIRGRRGNANLPAHVVAAAREMERGTLPRTFRVVEAAGDERFVIEPVHDMKPAVCIYGAGHVGRAVVEALSLLDFEVHWFDLDFARFPVERKHDVRYIASGNLVACVPETPRDAYHLVMTFSHTLDEALVRALIQRGDTEYVGMIGSKTKAARFRQKFVRDGLASEQIARLVSPIGIAGLTGKAPAVIAASVAADLLQRRQAAEGRFMPLHQRRSRPGT